jgi:hypothetical protein
MNEEEEALDKYYKWLDENKWRPIQTDLERDIKRWNCQTLASLPVQNTNTVVIMPAEDCSNALYDFQLTNPIDIIERLILQLNSITPKHSFINFNN